MRVCRTVVRDQSKGAKGWRPATGAPVSDQLGVAPVVRVVPPGGSGSTVSNFDLEGLNNLEPGVCGVGSKTG